MLHIKFRGNRPAGSGEAFRRIFTMCGHGPAAWQPSWSCDPDAADKIAFSLPKEVPHKI